MPPGRLPNHPAPVSLPQLDMQGANDCVFPWREMVTISLVKNSTSQVQDEFPSL